MDTGSIKYYTMQLSECTDQVLLTSPVIATIGLSATIPFSIVSDLAQGNAVTLPQYLASAAVVGGFVLVTKGRTGVDAA